MLLVRRRLSAAKLAQQLGWSQPYMARRMSGAQTFDLDDLEQIADALGVTIYDLLPTPDEGDQNLRKRRPPVPAAAPAWNPPAPREPVVSGTVAHPGHPVLAGAVRLPGPIGVRRTSLTGR